MKSDGFSPIVVGESGLYFGQTVLKLFPHDTGSVSDVDSFLLLEYESPEKTHRILNLNDCDVSLNGGVLDALVKLDLDIVCAAYTDASSYPQAYYDEADEFLPMESRRRSMNKLQGFKTIAHLLKSQIYIPFAGQYLLGGYLAELNAHRGVIDAVEAAAEVENALVLEAGGAINTNNFTPTCQRKLSYPEHDVAERVLHIKSLSLPHESFIIPEQLNYIPIARLLRRAFLSAHQKSEIFFDYF